MSIRIKMIRNLSNPQRTERSIDSPQIKKHQKIIPPLTQNRKRSKSGIVIVKKQQQSPRKLHIQRYPLTLNDQIFSKLKSISSLPEQKVSQNNIKSQRLNKGKFSLHIKPINSAQESEDLTSETQQINKFPHYVSKSNQMVEMKQKLLQLKHRIKLNHSFPVLESIQNSINENRAWFTRKMKVQVSKRGNTSLMNHFEKDLFQYLQHDSPQKCKSQQKHYRPINLSYLMALQPKDENSFDKYQRVQKMQEIKRNLKAVRKTNLQRIK